MCNACALALNDPRDDGMSADQVKGKRWGQQRGMPVALVQAGPNYTKGGPKRKPKRTAALA